MPNAHKKIDVLVVDYGVGNHESVTNALARLGYKYLVSSTKEDIEQAPAYILPGVGAFEEAMRNLESRNIIEPLRKEVVEKKKPLLGICLGMQVLADDSTENGFHKGLGWVPGHVVKIEGGEGIRVPHVGWNEIQIRQTVPLFSKVGEGSRFYFDHSYHFKTSEGFIAATSSYGEDITAAVKHENISGVQFHPEKSQTNGLRILRSFFESYAR